MEELIGQGSYPPVRFIRDFVEVPLPWEKAAALLLEQTEGWLAELATGAILEREPIRARIGLKAGGIFSAEVIVTLAAPKQERDGVTIPMTWEAPIAWLFPRLDGLLGLSRLQAEECQLWLEGSYRAPFGKPGQLVDQALMHRIADATIRGFLAKVAQALVELSRQS